MIVIADSGSTKQTGVWVTPRQTAGQFEQEVSTPSTNQLMK